MSRTKFNRTEPISAVTHRLAEVMRDTDAAVGGVLPEHLKALGYTARTLAEHGEAAAALAARRSTVLRRARAA